MLPCKIPRFVFAFVFLFQISQVVVSGEETTTAVFADYVDYFDSFSTTSASTDLGSFSGDSNEAEKIEKIEVPNEKTGKSAKIAEIESKSSGDEKLANLTSSSNSETQGENVKDLDFNSILASLNVSENNIPVEDSTEDLNEWRAPYSIRKNFPYFLSGHDEEGRPIWVSEWGKYDIRSVTEKGGEYQAILEKYIQQAVFRVNQSIANASTEAQPVTEALYLVDFDGFDMRQFSYLPAIAFQLKLAITHREFIVNHLGGTIIVNANFLVENLVRVLRPVFGPAMAKVELFGSNKQKWIPVVRRVLGAQNLPDFYGGNKDFKPVSVFGR